MTLSTILPCQIERAPAECLTHRRDGLRDDECRRVEIDRHAARLGDVTQVGKEAVADVGHRRRAGAGRLGPGGIRRVRHLVRLDGDLRRAEAAAEGGEARRGEPEVTRVGHDVTGLCP